MVSTSESLAHEELLQFLYLTPVGIVKFHADGEVELINPAAAALLQPISGAAGLDNLFVTLEQAVPGLRDQVAAFREDTGIIINQARSEVQVGGKLVVISLTVNRVSATVYMAVMANITRSFEQSRLLFADQQKFRAIFDNIRDYAIYTVGLTGTIDEWNPSLERYAGWLAADVVDQPLSVLLATDDSERPDLEALLAEARRVGSVETEGWRRKRDGSRLWGNSVITALPDETGAVNGFVVVSRDMTERKRMEDEMRELATLDPLTGASNRRQGAAVLAAEFERSARSGEPFSLLMLDIDHFKRINDTFGHEAGDAVLRALVATCKSTLRSIDMVARWGGEEFLLMLPGADAQASFLAAERLRLVVAGLIVTSASGAAIAFTVSIGIAVSTGGPVDETIRRSDTALYDAKLAGRNRIAVAA